MMRTVNEWEFYFATAYKKTANALIMDVSIHFVHLLPPQTNGEF